MSGLTFAWLMARRRPKEYRRKVDATTRCSGVPPYLSCFRTPYPHNQFIMNCIRDSVLSNCSVGLLPRTAKRCCEVGSYHCRVQL